jgi:hypothetical protein
MPCLLPSRRRGIFNRRSTPAALSTSEWRCRAARSWMAACLAPLLLLVEGWRVLGRGLKRSMPRNVRYHCQELLQRVVMRKNGAWPPFIGAHSCDNPDKREGPPMHCSALGSLLTFESAHSRSLAKNKLTDHSNLSYPVAERTGECVNNLSIPFLVNTCAHRRYLP